MLLTDIYKNMNKEIGTYNGITLIGSKARKEINLVNEEYDIIVEIPTLLVPFKILKLKQIEKNLSNKYNVSLSINPLPTFRIKYPENNILYSEIVEYGITYYGEDLSSKIADHSKVDVSYIYSIDYLFHSAFNFLKIFNSTYPLNKAEIDENSFIYISLKTISQCCDSILILKGIYEHKLKNRFKNFKQFVSDLADGTSFFNRLLFYSSKYLFYRNYGIYDLDLSPLDLWFLANKFIQTTFKLLFKTIYGYEGSLFNISKKYLCYSSSRPLKNLQYGISSILFRDTDMKLLLSKESPCKLCQVVLLILLASLKRNSIDKEKLLFASTLFNMGDVDGVKFIDLVTKWNEIKNKLSKQWSYSCTTLI